MKPANLVVHNNDRKLKFYTWLPLLTLFNSPDLYQNLLSKNKLWIKVGDLQCKNGRVFHAEVAATPEKQILGLGNRPKPLDTNQAMIFIYQTPQVSHFWMKNTWIPLSIAFFDSKGAMIQSLEMKVEKDPNHPQSVYGPKRPFLVAIEANQGTFLNFPLKKTGVCVQDS